MRYLTALLFCCVLFVRAADIPAASVSYVDVLAAVTASTHGDRVVVPAGTAGWTNTLTFAKAITIQGAGIGLTIITNLQIADGNVGDQAVIYFKCVTNGVTRLTGLEINGNQAGNGIFIESNTTNFWNAFRIDRCKIWQVTPQAITANALLAGLIDQCTFIDNVNTILAYCSQTSPIDFMNYSWVQPLSLGTTNGIYAEDDMFLYQTWYPSTTAASSSAGFGGRRTIRNCIWTNSNQNLGFSPIIDAHGNQQPVLVSIQPNTSGLTNTHRGTRQTEFYNNKFVDTTTNVNRFVKFTHLRGGTMVFFDNTFTGQANKMDNSFFSQEEDAPYYNNFVTNYPGMDQGVFYFGTNLVNGVNIGQLSYADVGDQPYYIANTNVFFGSLPGGYIPLSYPHPLRVAEDGVAAVSTPTGRRISRRR